MKLEHVCNNISLICIELSELHIKDYGCLGKIVAKSTCAGNVVKSLACTKMLSSIWCTIE